jgi:hypothetical protein
MALHNHIDAHILQQQLIPRLTVGSGAGRGPIVEKTGHDIAPDARLFLAGYSIHVGVPKPAELSQGFHGVP